MYHLCLRDLPRALVSHYTIASVKGRNSRISYITVSDSFSDYWDLPYVNFLVLQSQYSAGKGGRWSDVIRTVRSKLYPNNQLPFMHIMQSASRATSPSTPRPSSSWCALPGPDLHITTLALMPVRCAFVSVDDNVPHDRVQVRQDPPRTRACADALIQHVPARRGLLVRCDIRSAFRLISLPLPWEALMGRQLPSSQKWSSGRARGNL